VRSGGGSSAVEDAMVTAELTRRPYGALLAFDLRSREGRR
jgi:hypothetical protein